MLDLLRRVASINDYFPVFILCDALFVVFRGNHVNQTVITDSIIE